MPSSKNSGENHGSKRGSGSMDENKQREAASKGGKVPHEKGDSSGQQSKSSTRSGTSDHHEKGGSQSHKKS